MSASWWYSDPAELVRFARAADRNEWFVEISDVIEFFAQPWKWIDEHARWVEVGRPDPMTEQQGEYIRNGGAASFAEWVAKESDS